MQHAHINQQRTSFVRSVTDAVAALYRQDNLRLDANEAAFLERQLEYIEGRLYQVKFPELKYRRLVPINNEGQGAETITYYLYTKTGMAKIISNPADDLPRSDVHATRHTQDVFSIGTSFGYSTKALRSALQAMIPLDTMKVDAARRAIRQKESSICWNGDAGSNIVGLFAHPNIPTVQAPLNAGATSRAWADKTPDEIIADITTLVSGIRDATLGTHEPNTLILPIVQYNKIALTPRSTISDTTILEFITKPGNSFGLTDVTWLNEIKGAGTGASDMALVYEKDPEVLELRIPMEMMTHPPQMRNLEFKVPVEAENGGVVVRYPLALRSMYDI